MAGFQTFTEAFSLLENIRLRKSHRLLKEVLESERTYESLLTDVRQERDNLHVEVQRLRLGQDMTRAVQDLATLAGVQRALPAPKQREESDDE